MSNLREIGQRLKEAREAQNLTIEDVATRTRISGRHLLALEEGNEGDLPELFYIRGFLKKYAEVVGLSPSEAADAFQKAPVITPVETNWRQSVGPIVYYMVIVLLIGGGLALAWHFQPKVSVVSEPSAVPSVAPKPKPALAKKPASASPALAVAAAASSRPSARPAPASIAPSAASAPEASVGAVTPAEDASPTPEPTPQPAAGQKALEVSATATAWVEVTVDGQRGYRGTMKRGDKQRFKGKRIEVYSGNAGGVHIRLDGKDAGTLGGSGKVVDKYY